MGNNLFALNGSYFGSGVNHENQKFEGSIQLTPIAGGKGAQLSFKATGLDGKIYHEETSLLGPGFDEKPCLFVLSNNHPAVTPHVLKSEAQTSEGSLYVFGFGKISDPNSFREEITLQIFQDGSVSYTYAWGLPGGEFQERSGVRMFPKAAFE